MTLALFAVLAGMVVMGHVVNLIVMARINDREGE